MPSGSCHCEQVIVNDVLVVPLSGAMEQEPFVGGRLMMKLKALELVSDWSE